MIYNLSKIKIKIKTIIFFLIFPTFIFSQINFNHSEEYNKLDTIITPNKSKKISVGGIFLSPNLGFEIPLKEFSTNSSTAISYGFKLEYANSRLYPFIFGANYQYEFHNGKDDFKTLHYINVLETRIHSFGISFDVLLNKYLKSEFTIPFITLDIKYYSVSRNMDPLINTLNLNLSDNFIGFSPGAGFTLYIFDIYGMYSFAKNYSCVSLKTRIHFPLIKF